ncbi:primase-helicase family protein [Sulfurimonas sp. C5]|uniref:primase-helicase family protein n=1 Tax=Sulfurimonas sp. C5 TaxID=3036947 RepID=UPI0024561BDB|nr:primase-helicase family protein [Sulfurimonas sp. C5]MDH4943524.1 DUF5906 domain-containing protein [Sulfurimonas sp. C5]
MKKQETSKKKPIDIITNTLSMSFARVRKDKVTTFGYKMKHFNNAEEFIVQLNSEATIPVSVEGGHRKTSNITEVFGWIRFDTDLEGEADELEKLFIEYNLWFIKKPSTNHKSNPYKFHFLIQVTNVAQHPTAYKLQVAEFMERFNVPKIQDMRATTSLAQNLNPCKEDVSYCRKHTVINEGEVVELKTIDEEFEPIKEGRYANCQIKGDLELPEFIGEKALKIPPVNKKTGEVQTPILSRDGFILSEDGWIKFSEIEEFLHTQPKGTRYSQLACPICNKEHSDGTGFTTGYAFAYISNNEKKQLIVQCGGSGCSGHSLYILDDGRKEANKTLTQTEVMKMIEDAEFFEYTAIEPLLDAIACVDVKAVRGSLCNQLKDRAERTYKYSVVDLKKDVEKRVKDQKDATGSFSLTSLFEHPLFWDSNKAVMAEVGEGVFRIYKPTDFNQTVASRSKGAITVKDVTNYRHTIPEKILVYKPDHDNSKKLFEDGLEAINIYQTPPFKRDKSIKTMPPYTKQFLNTLFESDKKAKKYFIHWLAYIVQKRKKTGIAWVFHGLQGSGKGITATIISHLVGKRNCRLNLGNTDLESQFNGYMFQSMFLEFNEVAIDIKSRTKISNTLKTIITDSAVEINQKNVKQFSAINYTNVIISSNSSKPIQIEPDDRRFNVVTTKNKLIEQSWWNEKAHDQIMFEVEEFYNYLMNLVIDVKKATRVMKNSIAKENMVGLTNNKMNQLIDALRIMSFEKFTNLFGFEPKDKQYQEAKWSFKHKRFRTTFLIDCLAQSGIESFAFTKDEHKFDRAYQTRTSKLLHCELKSILEYEKSSSIRGFDKKQSSHLIFK